MGLDATRAERYVAVLQVRRPRADLRDGWHVDLAAPPTAEAAASMYSYFARGGADTEQMRVALEHIDFVPYDHTSEAVVHVSVLQVPVPEQVTGSDGSVVTALWRRFVLPGRNFSETCAALQSAGCTVHAWAEDAVLLAIDDRWRSDGG